MTTERGTVRMKAGMNWKERAEELHGLGQALYREHATVATELRLARGRLATASAALAWADANPWTALWRRLVGRKARRAS